MGATKVDAVKLLRYLKGQSEQWENVGNETYLAGWRDCAKAIAKGVRDGSIERL
jgi:hypothetical protein